MTTPKRRPKLTRRQLYKPERKPARDRGIRDQLKDVRLFSLPDATSHEIALALFVIGWEAGIVVGRGCGYDRISDKFTVIGKSRYTGKAQDFNVRGEDVADVIMVARSLNGRAFANLGMHTT